MRWRREGGSQVIRKVGSHCLGGAIHLHGHASRHTGSQETDWPAALLTRRQQLADTSNYCEAKIFSSSLQRGFFTSRKQNQNSRVKSFWFLLCSGSCKEGLFLMYSPKSSELWLGPKVCQPNVHKVNCTSHFLTMSQRLPAWLIFFCDSKMLLNTLLLKGIHGWWPYLAAGVPYTLPPPKPPPPYSGG